MVSIATPIDVYVVMFLIWVSLLFFFDLLSMIWPGTTFYFACETKEELAKWLPAVMQSATAPYSSGGGVGGVGGEHGAPVGGAGGGRDHNGASPSSAKGSALLFIYFFKFPLFVHFSNKERPWSRHWPLLDHETLKQFMVDSFS